MADLPFVVLKFVPDDDDNNNIYYDIGLSKWLIRVNEDMEGETYWPPHNVEAGSLVLKEANADKTRPKYRVHIKRYHDEYTKTRDNVKGITKHDDSNYETEKELGRGMRRKTNKILSSTSSSDSDEEKCVKKSTKAVAAPPNVQPPLHCDFYNSVPSYSHFNESQKKKLNIKVDVHKSRSIQKQQASLHCSGVKEKLLNVQNVLDARKRAAGQIQKKLSLQSLSSNRIINDINSLKKQPPQKHQIELVHTERSKCNEQTLSENKMTEKNNNKLQQSEKISPLPNVENNSDFENSTDFTSTANYEAVKKSMLHTHTDIPSEAASKYENMELPQFYDKNSDESQKFSSFMQDLRLQIIKVDRKLEEINYKIDTVIMNQGKLNRSLLPHEKKRLKPHNMPCLPLINQSDVQAMEKWLCDDENNIALCDYLTSFGSASDEKKFVTTIMQKLMYNSLAKHYNFDGHGEKIGFKTLKLWTVIEVTLSVKFPDSELEIAVKTIKSWLRNASGRKQEEESNRSDSQG